MSAAEYVELNDIDPFFDEGNAVGRSTYTNIRQQASSDVLGNQHYGDRGTGKPSSVISSSSTWALTDFKSSSTLKSFYDPDKYPLPISQQTSESAIRDMALRKGKAIVIGKKPSKERKDEVVEEPAWDYSASTAGSRSTATTTAKRPPRLDLTRLFTRPISTPGITSPSPSTIMQSPSMSSEYFNQQSPHFGQHAANSIANGMKSPVTPHSASTVKSFAMSIPSNGMRSPMLRSGSKLLKARPSPSSLKRAYQNRFKAHSERPEVKQSVYRPTQSAKNWFDGVLEEEDAFDEEIETEASTTTKGVHSYGDHGLDSQVQKGYPGITDQFYSPVEDHFNPSGPTSFIVHQGRSRREMDYISSRPSTLKSANTPVSATSLAIPQSSMSPISRQTSRTSRTRESLLANSDLGDTSILSLSSSDGESEDGDSIDYSRLPRFRNSIQVSDTDSIVIAEAQAFRIPANRPPKTTKEAVQRRRESVASTGSMLSTSTAAETSSIHSSITGPTYLAVPPRRDRPRRSGHTRQPSSIPEDNHNGKPALPSSAVSPPSSCRSSIPGDVESVKSEPRKMMAVTEEEEALLEMMRSKRAAMAKHSMCNRNHADEHSISSPASSKSRANRPTSTSSSILDSFPISRSQRSSLMAANLDSNPQLDPLNAVNASAVPTAQTDTRARVDSSQRQRSASAQSRDTRDTRAQPDSSHRQRSESTQSRPTLDTRGRIDSSVRQRSGSTQSRATQHSKRTSTTSSITSRLEHSYSAFPPHLSFAPLDINLGTIPSSTYPRASLDARSLSPEPFSSPSTPQTRRGSADFLIRSPPSQRNSLASFGHLVHAMEHTLYSDVGCDIHDVTFNKETQRHSRRRTASSEANVPLDSEDDDEELPIFTGMAMTKMASSVKVRRKPVPGQQQNHDKPTAHATSASQAENRGYVWERDGDNVGLSFARTSMAERVGSVGTASSRCSVSEDVLAAWGSLGGWRDVVM
ncbi:hypothetical protein BLS_004559 [Venturia inaequalis]|uniref:Uncharacterized protein n=1 Tax=Venturia inaequalis TaxID=5025 RepID=A0A8H3Z2Y8_VENIN|nr:hypothetical protein BLS_004559 [Venturia inaequalis]KAE9993976.1 hypothetical protein EG327_002016 [Venturia inaequalis]RDI81573.1 hypothetical protein Vi05172_g8360 [Venturia inaequalis]